MLFQEINPLYSYLPLVGWRLQDPAVMNLKAQLDAAMKKIADLELASHASTGTPSGHGATPSSVRTSKATPSSAKSAAAPRMPVSPSAPDETEDDTGLHTCLSNYV